MFIVIPDFEFLVLIDYLILWGLDSHVSCLQVSSTFLQPGEYITILMQNTHGYSSRHGQMEKLSQGRPILESHNSYYAPDIC